MYYLEPNKDHRTQSTRGQTELSTTELHQDITYHYDDCYDIYSGWCNEDNLAYHYGYWASPKRYNHHQSLSNMNAELYQKAGIKTTDEVLDAGCGIGGSSIWMAKHHQNKVTGITLSAKQVQHALNNAQRHQVSELTRFEVADYCATPFADESFDVVWALESSCHALNKSDFLKEAYRLLRKGGRIVVADGFILQHEFSEQQWHALEIFLNGWGIPNFCTGDEFSALLTNCNFQNIQTADITQYILPSSDYMYKTTKWFYPWIKFTHWLGLRSKAQVADYEVGFAQREFFRGGIANYCVFTATK
jgi:tocopherol O-methyltransferase